MEILSAIKGLGAKPPQAPSRRKLRLCRSNFAEIFGVRKLDPLVCRAVLFA